MELVSDHEIAKPLGVEQCELAVEYDTIYRFSLDLSVYLEGIILRINYPRFSVILRRLYLKIRQ